MITLPFKDWFTGLATAAGSVEGLAVESDETKKGAAGGTVDTAPANEPTHAISSQWAYGVQGDRTGWRDVYESTSNLTQASPASNTFYNLGSASIGPFGANGEVWDISYDVACYASSGVAITSIVTDLSTSTSGTADKKFWAQASFYGGSFTGLFFTLDRKLRVTLTGSTTLYMLAKYLGTSAGAISFRGDIGKISIIAQKVK
jgi:hypothetical protein